MEEKGALSCDKISYQSTVIHGKGPHADRFISDAR
jgi:hypothetical protein